MGGATRQARCNRFIQEFNDRAKELYGPRSGNLLKSVHSFSLGVNDYTGYVLMYMQLIDGDDVLLVSMDSHVLFDPEEQEDEVIARVVDELEMSEEEAIRSLLRANLIEAPDGGLQTDKGTEP